MRKLSLTRGFFRKAIEIAAQAAIGTAYFVATLAIAFGGIYLVASCEATRHAKRFESAAWLSCGDGSTISIPSPAGTESNFRFKPPPNGRWSYCRWERGFNDFRAFSPYEGYLFLRNRSMDFVPWFEYIADGSPDSAQIQGTFRFLVPPKPGEDAATWEEFVASGEVLKGEVDDVGDSRDYAAAFFKGGRWHDVRITFADDKGGANVDVFRFVWLEGHVFLLEFEACNRHPANKAASADVIASAADEAVKMLDDWLDAICVSAGVASGAPESEEIARGAIFAKVRQEEGIRTCPPVSEDLSPKAIGRMDLWMEILDRACAMVLVVVIGCLSVTVVWALALVAALVVFGKKTETQTAGVEKT